MLIFYTIIIIITRVHMSLWVYQCIAVQYCIAAKQGTVPLVEHIANMAALLQELELALPFLHSNALCHVALHFLTHRKTKTLLFKLR